VPEDGRRRWRQSRGPGGGMAQTPRPAHPYKAPRRAAGLIPPPRVFAQPATIRIDAIFDLFDFILIKNLPAAAGKTLKI